MNTLYFLFRTIFLLLVFIFPASLAESRAQSLLFKESSAELGAFSSADLEITHRFIFKNVSDKTLKIKNIEADCACATSNYDSKPIFPNATDTLEVSFLPYSPGNFVKSFEATADNGEKYTLQIKGFVRPEDDTFLNNRYPYKNGRLRFKTKSVNFGSIPDNMPVSRKAEIYNYTDSLITFTGEINSPKYLKVYFDSGNTVKPGEIGALYFVFDPVLKNEAGFFDESAELFTNDPAAPRLIIPVSVHVRGEVEETASAEDSSEEEAEEIVPNEAEETEETPVKENRPAAEMPSRPVLRLSEDRQNLGLIRSKIKTVTEFIIHNDGAKVLVINEIRTKKGLIVLTEGPIAVSAGGQKVIKVRFDSEGFAGKIMTGFTLFSNDPNAAEKNAEIVAEIVE